MSLPLFPVTHRAWPLPLLLGPVEALAVSAEAPWRAPLGRAAALTTQGTQLGSSTQRESLISPTLLAAA